MLSFVVSQERQVLLPQSGISRDDIVRVRISSITDLNINFNLQLIEIEMEELKLEDQEKPINFSIKRPFIGKFIKQLNCYQNNKHKQQLRKQKSLRNLTPTFRDIHEGKSSRKIQEVVKNGNKIKAVWKNDFIQGEAEIEYQNGTHFKGFYAEGLKQKGHFKFSNGFQYEGSLLGNNFNGQGRLIFPSGKVISGKWKNSNVIGKARVQYPQGEVFYGDLKNMKKHGHGHLFFTDGNKYVGGFRDGLICGNGIYYENDKPISAGRWNNGELIKEVQLKQSQDYKEDTEFFKNLVKDDEIIEEFQKQRKVRFS